MISENVSNEKEILPTEEEIKRSLQSNYSYLDNMKQLIQNKINN